MTAIGWVVIFPVLAFCKVLECEQSHLQDRHII